MLLSICDAVLGLICVFSGIFGAKDACHTGVKLCWLSSGELFHRCSMQPLHHILLKSCSIWHLCRIQDIGSPFDPPLESLAPIQMLKCPMDVCILVVQALPGSRLDTSLLKEWLMQHLASLHFYQSQVSAAEAASRQKRHAAAAAAAVTAAKLEAGEEEEHEEASAEGTSQQLRGALTLPERGAEASVQLPARVIAAAAAAASAAAMGAAVTALTADNVAVSKVAGPVQQSANASPIEHSKIASLPLVASRSAGQVHTHSQTATHLNPASPSRLVSHHMMAVKGVSSLCWGMWGRQRDPCLNRFCRSSCKSCLSTFVMR